jgi:glycosyltransferase involved in cell wall biosynthesis
MRIVHVSDVYLPRLGGIEKHVHDLASRQAADGHDVRIITTVADPQPNLSSPVEVVRPVPVDGKSTGRMQYRAALGLARWPLLADADVVHVHASTVSPLAFAAIGTTSRNRKPTVVSMHSMLGTGPAFRLAEAAFAWRGDAVEWTAVSEAAARPLARALGSNHPVNVLGNGIDATAWACPPRVVNPQQIVVGTVGRLARRKRPAALVRIMRDVRAALPRDIELQAFLVGDGPLRSSLHGLLQRYDMQDWMTVLGPVDRATIHRVLGSADLYVAPARLESFGIAALEARSSGLPVIARRGSGIAEFVTHGVDGMFGRDDDEMAEHIVRFAVDPSFREALSRTSELRLPSFDWRDVLPRTYAAYSRAAERARTSMRARLLSPA